MRNQHLEAINVAVLSKTVLHDMRWYRPLKHSLHDADWDSYLIPARAEAFHNNRASCRADGCNWLNIFPDRWARQCLADGDLARYEYAQHWHEQLKRK